MTDVMSADQRVRIYEQSCVREAVGETIRPGGLALTERALAFCALPPGARVLDVGCGAGVSVEHLSARLGFAAVGIDPSALLLRAAHSRNGALPLAQSPGERLPIGGAQVDALLAECSLSVMQDMDRALDEFWRVLRPGGHLIVSDLYARDADGVTALRGLSIASCLSGAVSRQTLIERVQAHGFAVQLWEDHTDALKVFAARLIWSNGSLPEFWCRAASLADSSDIQAAVARSRPGYYLLIARKMERGSHGGSE